jgi:carbon monoxide dehydrogenase subunit G
MLRFEGDRSFALPAEALWAKLTDARFLARCVPDVQEVKESAPDHASLVLRPGFSFVRGTLEVELRVTDPVPPHSARVLVSGRGIGSTSEVEATLALAAEGEATKVHWTAEVKTLGGLLKMVPAGLIRGAAEKVVNDAWNAVEAKVKEG